MLPQSNWTSARAPGPVATESFATTGPFGPLRTVTTRPGRTCATRVPSGAVLFGAGDGDGRTTAEVASAARQKVVVEGRPVEPEDVRVRPGKDGRSIIDLTLQEGRNRIVRRWVEAMGLKVDRLARLSYGPVRLGDLPPGRYRPLTPAGKQWLHDMTQHEGWQWLGGALAVEPRMVCALVEGAREDGLEVG